MMKRCFVVLLIVAALLLPQTAFAWNYTGHEVIARIAWEKMQPQTRIRVMAVVSEAPRDADLASMLPTDSRISWILERDLFMLAGTWPDIIRSDEFPERKLKYHHSNWHYTNLFWRQRDRVAVDVPELQPDPVNIVERLNFLQAEALNRSTAKSQLGIDVAWLVHLIGDIHQPLHTSARVTDTEPTGDQGGNLFFLTPVDTPPKEAKRLHGYWDDILNKSIQRVNNETDLAYANRIASMIMRRQPAARFKDQLNLGKYQEWCREGLAAAKTSVYPPWLKRFEPPSERYRRQVYSVAEPAIALAGYRLAATLDGLFGQ